MNRSWFPILWALEVIAILAVALLLMLPIQDYAMREFKEWQRHPSAETEKALRDKQREEPLLRLAITAPFATAALLLAIPLFRLRRNQQEPSPPNY